MSQGCEHVPREGLLLKCIRHIFNGTQSKFWPIFKMAWSLWPVPFQCTFTVCVMFSTRGVCLGVHHLLIIWSNISFAFFSGAHRSLKASYQQDDRYIVPTNVTRINKFPFFLFMYVLVQCPCKILLLVGADC